MRSHYFIAFTAFKAGAQAVGNTCVPVDGEFDPSLMQILLCNQFGADMLMITFYAPISEAVFDNALARDITMLEYIQRQKKDS